MNGGRLGVLNVMFLTMRMIIALLGENKILGVQIRIIKMLVITGVLTWKRLGIRLLKVIKGLSLSNKANFEYKPVSKPATKKNTRDTKRNLEVAPLEKP